MSFVPRSVSFFDLKKIPGCIPIIQQGTKEQVDNLLWQYGFDTKIGVEYVHCLHRPKTATTNEPIEGIMVMGAERRDSEWLASEHASDEAKIEYCEDVHMREDLIALSHTGGADKVWEDDEVAKSVIEKEKKRGN